MDEPPAFGFNIVGFATANLGHGVALRNTAAILERNGVPFRVLSEEAERTILEEALAHHGGQMAKAARALDLERSHLYKKARALGLRGQPGDEEPS